MNILKLKSALVALPLLLGPAAMPASGAEAQAQGPQVSAQPSDATRAQQLSGDIFIRNALATVQALDAGRAAQVYDAGSAALKAVSTRQQFVEAVASTNARTGGVVAREWSRLERVRVAPPAADAAAPAVPEGSYVTVYLLARTARGHAHLEQVSFRLDEDNQWRLAGVTAALPQQRPQQPQG